MTESDRAAGWVDDLWIKFQGADDRERLRSKRLVELDALDRILFDSSLLEGARDCFNRTDAHHARRYAGDGKATKTSHRLKVVAFHKFFRHHKAHAGAIRHLGGVTRGDAAAFLKGRAQFSESFHCRVTSRTFVLFKGNFFYVYFSARSRSPELNIDRNDLFLEQAIFYGCRGFLI